MSNTTLKNITTDIRHKRKEIDRLREELDDMTDHLAVIEARAKNAGKPRHSADEVRKKLGL
jgi:hypothetical protein